MIAYFTDSAPSISVQSGRQMDCRVIQYCSFPSEQIPTTPPPNCFLDSAIYEIMRSGTQNSPKQTLGVLQVTKSPKKCDSSLEGLID